MCRLLSNWGCAQKICLPSTVVGGGVNLGNLWLIFLCLSAGLSGVVPTSYIGTKSEALAKLARRRRGGSDYRLNGLLLFHRPSSIFPHPSSASGGVQFKQFMPELFFACLP